MEIENVIFDFGGVLVEWNSDFFYRSYFGDDALMQRFYTETGIKTLNKEIDKGLPFDYALKSIAEKYPQYRQPILLWKNAWNKMLGDTIEGSIKILHSLNQKGYSLYGLTNWSAETFPYAYYTHAFFQIFKDIVVSGREKIAKPDPEIYELCINRNNIEKTKSVFIDDNQENVVTAQRVGMRAILFKNPEQLRNDLYAMGVSF